MNLIKVKPIVIIGECPLAISYCDEFFIEGNEIKNPKESTLCYLSLTHMLQCIWTVQSKTALIMNCSCPGCIKNLKDENRVFFMLGFEENWSVGELVNKYNKLLAKYKEPEDARKLRLKAEIYLQGENKDLAKALLTLNTALKMFRKCSGIIIGADYI